uniref:Uncharacterized protein n=1 Tax=Cucumis melo TaxID=3656 RepID=A0A9I9D5R9_CUCME
MHLIEQLYIKAYLELEKLPQVAMKDRVYTTLTLHRVIVIHKNKAKTKCLKTKQEGQIKVVEEVEEVQASEEEEREEDNFPLKHKRQGKEEA